MAVVIMSASMVSPSRTPASKPAATMSIIALSTTSSTFTSG